MKIIMVMMMVLAERKALGYVTIAVLSPRHDSVAAACFYDPTRYSSTT